MADESIKISVTPAVRNPRRNSICVPGSPDNGNAILPPSRRASVGSCHVGGNSRRNSTEKPTSRSSGENIIPHYLRASTGSCHDFCKYGKKHANEVKPWKSKPKRAVSSSSDEQSNITVVAGERKKATMVKFEPSLQTPEVIKQNNTTVVPGERKKTTMVKLEPSPEPPEVIKRNTTTSVPRERKNTTMMKLEPSEPPQVIKQKNTSVVPGERKKTKVANLKSSPEPPAVIKQKSTTKVPGERKKTTMVKLNSSPEPPEVIKREVLLPSRKVEVSLKRDSLSARKVTDDDLKMQTKRSPLVKPKPAVVKSPYAADASVGLNGRRKSDVKTGKKAGKAKAVLKKVLILPTASLSPKSSLGRVLSLKARKDRSLKLVSPLKDQNRMPKSEPMQPGNDKVHEKTLHIVEAETTENIDFKSLQTDGMVQSFLGPLSPSALSPKSSPHGDSQGSYFEDNDVDYSEYTNSEEEEEEEDGFISENDDIVNSSGLETLKGDDKRDPRKGRANISEENDAAAVKLKFRRGRIIDVQSENNGPRRLRFRRGRVLGDDGGSQGDSRRRTYKKRSDNETKDSRLSTEKVILKHQDVQGKKDTQGLFNNVIKETASKLVETRKSKVKALVGAFETVISLQDGKPSTQTVTRVI